MVDVSSVSDNFLFNFSQEIKSNITSPVPRFSVASLSPGNVYILSVYAFNAKGRSDPTVLNAAMLRMPEKQLTERGEFYFSRKIKFPEFISFTFLLFTIT